MHEGEGGREGGRGGREGWREGGRERWTYVRTDVWMDEGNSLDSIFEVPAKVTQFARNKRRWRCFRSVVSWCS